MYCNNCRRIIENTDAAFCPECGSPLVPAPFAGDMPPSEAVQSKDTATGIKTAQNDPVISKPESAPVRQTGTEYGHGTENSDTAAFAALNYSSSAVNNTAQIPPAPPTLSPPPLHTGEKSSKRHGKPSASKPKRGGVPTALIVVAVILFVLVAGFAFLLLYFGLDISDLLKIISEGGALSGSTMQYSDVDGTNDSLKTGGDTDTIVALPTPTPRPTEVPRAESTASTLVIRNAHANARLLVDGVDTPFDYVGNDLVVERYNLPEVCQVRLVTEDDGTYETAAVWYNAKRNDELSFGADYGDYVPCDASGLGVPSVQFIDVLLWAYHRGFLTAINEQSTAYLQYSTDKNTYAENDHVFSTANARNTYDLDDFQVGCDADSVTYSNDGKVLLNATFVSYATNRQTGSRAEVVSRKTMELVWEDGMWKVNRLAFVNDNDYEARRYADLP